MDDVRAPAEDIDVLPPAEDADVPAFWRGLGLPGLADIHTHFLPPRMLRRVWAYFDTAGPLVGVSWPIRYKWSDEERVAHLRSMGVRMFSALAYAHRPDMAADLNAWTLAFGQATPGCLPSATFYPEPGVTRYVHDALDAGLASSRSTCRSAASRSTTRSSSRCGGCSPRPGYPWSCTPGTRRLGPSTPARSRSAHC